MGIVKVKCRCGTGARTVSASREPKSCTFFWWQERPEGFDARTHARDAFGITGGEKPMKVRLLFEPKLAVYISERQWHPTQVLKKRGDGRIELRMETTGRKELVRWVLSWMPDVRVLAPNSLRDRM